MRELTRFILEWGSNYHVPLPYNVDPKSVQDYYFECFNEFYSSVKKRQFSDIYILSESLLSQMNNKMSLQIVKRAWKNADAVSFDVDSTVICDEGIDELAKFCGKGDQVMDLTRKAMQGNMTFQQSLTVRLNIIQPHLRQIKEFIQAHPPRLTPGIKELVDELHARNKQVFLVSGGFRCLISPVAGELNIAQDNICANRLKFYFNGDFAGFDENEPTSRSGGKAEVIRRLKEKFDFKTIVHVGDGATDLEACPPADAFIGFGGNVVRESVKNGSLWFVKDFKELQDALD